MWDVEVAEVDRIGNPNPDKSNPITENDTDRVQFVSLPQASYC